MSNIPSVVKEPLVSEYDRWSSRSQGLLAGTFDLIVKLLDADRERLVEDLRLKELEWFAPKRAPQILDVGTATGANLRVISKHLPFRNPADLWGLDLSERMLRKSRRIEEYARPHRLHLVRADAHRLPFADCSFDRVICSGCDFADWQTAISEMLRVCRAGGVLCVAGISRRASLSVFNAIAYSLYVALMAQGRPPPAISDFIPDRLLFLRNEQFGEMNWIATVRV